MIPHITTFLPRLAAPLLPDVLWRVPTSQRRLYLTFDDGPTPDVTPRVADVLSRHDASATFFLLGKQVRSHPEIARRLLEGGHQLGNHSSTHPDPWLSPRRKLLAEMRHATDLIEDATGSHVQFCRPPYGRLTPALRSWCRTAGQILTMWDVMPGDYLRSATGAYVERFILRHVRPGSIIVLHDNVDTRDDLVVALDSVLRILSADGWSFGRLPLPTDSTGDQA